MLRRIWQQKDEFLLLCLLRVVCLDPPSIVMKIHIHSIVVALLLPCPLWRNRNASHPSLGKWRAGF